MAPEGGWLLVAMRGLADATMLSLFGALVVRATVASAGLGIARWSAAGALIALPAWLAAEALALGGSLAATPDVLMHTQFGHLVAGSAGCVLAAVIVAGRGWRVAGALAAAGGALVIQARHGHAAAMEPGVSVLGVASVLHVLAAGAWLGGLLPLRRVVATAPLDVAAATARRFSWLGIVCVLVLAATAAWQGGVLVGGVAGWVGTEYGWIACAKLALFTTLLALATLNRQRFVPALPTPGGRKNLVRSIAIETCLGLVTVAAAALLTSVEPAMHQQPMWPFAVAPSLVTVSEDAVLRNEAITAITALGGAMLLLGACMAWRRFRVPAAAVAAATAWLAVPHLDLLFVSAYPTSFFRSPTAFAASAIVRGAELYPQHCAACHGADGRGNGPGAVALPIPPADLTAEHLWMHSDGELFWWLSHGIEAPNGGMAMPGLADSLSDDDRWALIDFVRARNAGLHYAASGTWSPAIPAPDLVAACEDGRSVEMADLRGRAVRLVFAGGVAPEPLAGGAATTIIVGNTPAGCHAADPAVLTAYAIVLGTAAGELSGKALLIDSNGWVRSLQPAELDPAMLAEQIRHVSLTPIAANSGSHHHAH